MRYDPYYGPFADDPRPKKPSLYIQLLTAIRDRLRARRLARMQVNRSEFPDSEEYIRATGDMSHVC